MCYPWNYPRPVDKDLPLCQYFGNDCFYSKFQNNTYKQQNCNCLPACNEVNYKYVIDSNRKFSREEIDELCEEGTPHYRNILQSETEHLELLKLSNLTFYLPDHVQTVCKRYVKTQYARIRLKMDGTSYLRRIQSLKYNDSDKFAIIGGTLGLFTGFSFIVCFELLHWICVTIQKHMESNSECKPEQNIRELLVHGNQVSECKDAIMKPSEVVLEMECSPKNVEFDMVNQNCIMNDEDDGSIRRNSVFTITSFNSAELYSMK